MTQGVRTIVTNYSNSSAAARQTGPSGPLEQTDSLDRAEAQLTSLIAELKTAQANAAEVDGASCSIPHMLRHNSTSALRGFKAMDVLALLIGFVLAGCLAVVTHIVFRGHVDLVSTFHEDLVKMTQSILVGFCVILWFAHSGHYRMRIPFWTETKMVLEAMGFAMLIDIFFRFVVKQDFSRLWLISGWILAAVGVVTFRALWRARMRRKGLWNVSTLLVGGGETAQDARLALASEPGLGYKIVGQLKNLPSAFEKAGGSWHTLCAMHGADYVVVALDGQELMGAGPSFAQLIRDEVPFSVSPPLRHVPVLGMVPQYFFNHDVMLLTHTHGLNQRMPRVIKRAFDIIAASAALLALSPILAVIAFLVKSDGGPVLFGHKRLGLNGQTFGCLKFRSMIPNSNAVWKKHLEQNEEARMEWDRFHKLRDDPRITRVGAFLRRTSLDELPQLINVLKGHMSIVGPRPIIVAETEKYDNDITHYYRVRPGITGLWQVSGRNDVSYAERVSMDSWYVRNWSFWHDIAIICKTVPVVLKRKGAY